MERKENNNKDWHKKLPIRRNIKQHLVYWLVNECETAFDMGLTLMPRKIFYKYASGRRGLKKNALYRHLKKRELVEASKYFVELLNRLIYKNAYKRWNMRLDVVMVVEGDRELIDLHTHFAIKKPATMSIKIFAVLVKKALEMSGDFEVANPLYDPEVENLDKKYRYKLDIIDSDWLSYITKKLDSSDFHNLYLP